MSDETQNLKNEIEQYKQNSDSLMAQLEAGKQTLGENMQVCLNLRANLIIFQKKIQDLSAELETTKKLLNEANIKLKENENAINQVS